MSPAADPIAASRAHCRRVVRRSRSNFSWSFLLLRPPKREAMEALYAFLRHTDDLADGPEPLAERRAALNQWREAVVAGISDQGSEVRENDQGPMTKDQGLPPSLAIGPWSLVLGPSALLPALADAVQRFHIPAECLMAVLDGVQMDLDGRRYETFDELTQYCQRVASAVGLACIHIWGFRGQEALEPARKAGIAFQLTNILRDLKEDVSQGRIYLPLAELRQCGYSAEDLSRGVADDHFARLMAIQIRRARQLYHEGAELLDWLEPDGRPVFGVMTATYHALLERIARRPESVLGHRVRLSRWQKMRIAARWALLPPRRSALP